MIAVAEPVRAAAPPPLAERLARLGVPLVDLTTDSRAVKHGSVFLAYPGSARDGRAYIAEAIARGAAAVVWERPRLRLEPALGRAQPRRRGPARQRERDRGPRLRRPLREAVDGGRHRHQRQDLGGAVGGAGLRRPRAGARPSSARWATASWASAREAKNTTPDPVVLQRELADYLRRGAKVAAMEVSSHGLDQGRAAGIKFDVAVFTNLTRDHLDYHGTMEAYAEAKYRLFNARGVGRAVINVDDDWGRRFADRLRGSPVDVIGYGLAGRAPARAPASRRRRRGCASASRASGARARWRCRCSAPSTSPTCSR